MQRASVLILDTTFKAGVLHPKPVRIDLKRIEVKGRADGRSKGGGAAPASEAAPPGRIEVEIARSEVSPLVEAVLEYCRIVFDVLPATPASPTSPGLMVLATPDAADATANAATGPDLDDLMTLIPWEADTQALRPLTAALVGVKAAESARLCATLQLAVRELADRQAALSAEQVQSSMRERPQRVASCDAEAADELAHSTALLRAPLMRGRIVCFMLTHPGHEFVYSEVNAEGKVESIDLRHFIEAELLRVFGLSLCYLNCEVVFVTLTDDKAKEEYYTVQSSMKGVAALKYELHCVCIESLMEAVATLALTHYNLRAVRITGIPMKEGDSAIRADYDVLLLQASDNHIERDLPGILPAGAKPLESHPAVTTLRWTAEKKYDPMSYPSSCTHRLTPLKLTSSPSQCLMKYVLGGKPVKLASTGSSTITHLLSEHNGIVYLNCLRNLEWHYQQAAPSAAVANFYSTTEPYLCMTDFAGIAKSSIVHMLEPDQKDSLLQTPLVSDAGELKAKGSVAPFHVLRQTALFPVHLNDSIFWAPELAPEARRLLEPLRSYFLQPHLWTIEHQHYITETLRRLFIAFQTADVSMFPQTTPATRQEYYRLLWAEVLLFARRTDMLRNVPEEMQLGKFIERMFAAPQHAASMPTWLSKPAEGEQPVPPAPAHVAATPTTAAAATVAGTASSTTATDSTTTTAQTNAGAKAFQEYERNKRRIEQRHEGADTTHKQATDDVIREAKRRKREHTVVATAPKTSLLHCFWREREKGMDELKANLL